MITITLLIYTYICNKEASVTGRGGSEAGSAPITPADEELRNFLYEHLGDFAPPIGKQTLTFKVTTDEDYFSLESLKAGGTLRLPKVEEKQLYMSLISQRSFLYDFMTDVYTQNPGAAHSASPKNDSVTKKIPKSFGCDARGESDLDATERMKLFLHSHFSN